MRKKQQTTEHEDSHGHIISHHAPAAEKNIKVYIYILGLGDISHAISCASRQQSRFLD